MNPTELKDKTHLWFKAFNTKDLELLLSLYDEQAQHYSPKLKIKQPETNGLIQGKKALYDWWKDAFDRLPGLRYEIIDIMCDGTKVFMEYWRHNTGDETLRVGEILEFKDGKIVASRVYHS